MADTVGLRGQGSITFYSFFPFGVEGDKPFSTSSPGDIQAWTIGRSISWEVCIGFTFTFVSFFFLCVSKHQPAR